MLDQQVCPRYNHYKSEEKMAICLLYYIYTVASCGVQRSYKAGLPFVNLGENESNLASV